MLALTAGQEIQAKGFEVFRPEAAWVVEYRTGSASCAGRPLKQVDGDPVPPALNWFEGKIPALPEAPALEATFKVDAEGRPRSIWVQWTNNALGGVPARVGHVESILVGWRFETGKPSSDCMLPIATTATPVARAPRKLRLGVLGGDDGQFETMQGISPQKDLGTACRELRARSLVYPVIDPIQPPPGRRRWTALSFDVTAEGAPTAVKVEETSGPERFTEAARRVIEDSRFQPGREFKGCVAGIAVNGDLVPAPAPNSSSSPVSGPRDASARTGCYPAQPRFLHQGSPGYPAEMRRRSIEGRAVVRVDVTAEGEVLPREVVVSEPSSVFGEQAIAYVGGISAEPSTGGFSGCLMPVVFKFTD